MRSRVFFRVLIILACVGLTLSQKENMGLFWQEHYSLGRDFKLEDNSLEPHHLLIEAKIAKYDPEAALIVKTALMRSEGEKLVEVLAGGILSYPDNEFFLYRLVRLLLQPEMGIDPQIILKFADRLIAIKPDNAPYHYLKAYVLFRNRKGNNYDKILLEIERGNQCPDYISPYDNYHHRIIHLMEKAKLSNVLLGELPCRDEPIFLTSELYENLLGKSQQAFAEGQNDIGMRFGNISREMLRRRINGQDKYILCVLNLQRFSPISGFNRWYYSQELELKMANLSVERARQNRLELCALLNTKSTREETEVVKPEPILCEETTKTVFAAAPAVHCGRMFIVYLLLWLVLSIICLFRGYQPARIRWSVIAGFLCVSAFYFCLTQGLFLYSYTSSYDGFSYSYGYRFSYVDAFLFKPLDLDDILEDPLFWLFLVAPILVGIVLWSLGRNHKVRGFIFKNRWRKIFWIIPLSTLALGYLSYLARGYMYLRYVSMTLFVIFTALLLIYSPTERVSWYKVIYKIITSKDTQTIRLRSRILQLTGYFAVLYWLSLLFLAPATARSIKHCTGWYATYPPSTEYRLPEADEHIYQRVLDQFDKENLIKWEIYGLLGIVMPDDLPAVLRKLNTMKFSNPWDGMGMMPGPMSVNKKAILKEEEKIGLCDKDLIHIMEYCGRDVVDIIVDFMDNPENERALVGRARLGDRSVRGKLKVIWDSRKRDNFRFRPSSSSRRCGGVGPSPGPVSERPIRVYEILSGLACVCEPDEAAGYFLDYIDMDMTPGCDIHYDYEFFRNLRLLPSAQVREVLKAYLIKSENTAKINDEGPARTQFPPGMMPSGMTMLPRDVSIGMDIILRPLDNISDLYGNRKLAEMIFTIILSSSHYSESMGAWGIAPYFDSESAGLLRKGLSARDENLRAWCVCQLGRTGYKWHKEELEKLFMDKSWKVRANAVMAGGKESAAVLRDDRHAFVRLVGYGFYAKPN